MHSKSLSFLICFVCQTQDKYSETTHPLTKHDYSWCIHEMMLYHDLYPYAKGPHEISGLKHEISLEGVKSLLSVQIST